MLRTAPVRRRGRMSRAVADWRPSQIRRNAALLLAGLPLQAAGPVLAGVCLPLALLVLHVFLLGLAATVVVMFAAARPLTRLHRRRFQRLAGLAIPDSGGDALRWADLAAAARSRAGLGEVARRLVTMSRSGVMWRQLSYHLLAGPIVGLWALATLAAGPVGGIALAASGIIREARDPGGGKKAIFVIVVAGLLLIVTPRLLGTAARLDVWVASRLLGPGRAWLLARRVEALTQSRAGVVDAADAERRRLERDLHDGVQQRLVSLAMNLGIAKTTLADLPDDARKAIEEAHEEAKEAVAELRSLVRGLHPPILEDRGLDAALSGIAARAPFPVRVRVELGERPAPTVEAIAYFVVSEALANIAKHARASRAEVNVTQAGGLVRVRVADDGVGGADPGRGTGLAGLARRAASVDGSLSLSSPAGGPTEIVVELPCAL